MIHIHKILSIQYRYYNLIIVNTPRNKVIRIIIPFIQNYFINNHKTNQVSGILYMSDQLDLTCSHSRNFYRFTTTVAGSLKLSPYLSDCQKEKCAAWGVYSVSIDNGLKVEITQLVASH